jgi:hypothetical protein
MDLKILLDTPPWDWPKDAGKMFRKTLLDRRADPAERLIAADLAGDFTVINDDLARILIGIVGSPDEPEELRAKAAISFGAALESAGGGFDEPDEVPIGESTFHAIQKALHNVYTDAGSPKLVRRRVLEASVRALESWHEDAVRTAYSIGDREWMLTAVFSMCYVAGFDSEILEALGNADLEIHFEAVDAAGNWELDAAWPHVVKLLRDPGTSKPLLLASITAAANIRPNEAQEFLMDLVDSEDEDIAAAAEEALSMARPDFGVDDDEDEVGEWVN